MNERLENEKAITLIALVITIIILLILAGVAIGALGGENGLLSKIKLGKERYSISESKEKLELEIADLRVEQEGKGENLTKEDLPKINSDEIDVRNTDNFPVEVICGKYRFNVDENFIVTYLGEVDGTIITYTTDPEGYTNQDEVEILIKVSNPKGIKTIEYPDGDKDLSCNGKKIVAIDYKVTANGTYTFKIIDNEDKEILKDVVIDQIDKLAPLDFTPGVTKNGSDIVITSNAQDAEPDGISTKSGIDYYEYYLVDENNETKKYDTNEIEGLVGTYQLYVIAYDKAGNSKQSNVIKIDILTASKISAGAIHSLAIDSIGNLWAWGDNGYGELGDGTTTQRTSPVQIKSGTKFSQISAGCYYSLAIDEEGNLWAWGRNYRGGLGDGTTTDRTSPVQIKNGTKFSEISAGQTYSLAIDSEGNLWAWGDNGFGQLGDGTKTQRNSPVQIKAGTKFSKISAGQTYSLAIDSKGNLWAWGGNSYGQLGDGTTTDRTSPVQIKSGTKFTKVSPGYIHNLAIDSEGNLWSWGYNRNGQLGDGTTTDRTSPVQIKSGTKFSEVSGGSGHSLAIDSEGNLWAWGVNGSGQLGDGTIIQRTTPVQIESGTKFSQISAGYDYSLAIDIDYNLYGMGNTDGLKLDSLYILSPQIINFK